MDAVPNRHFREPHESVTTMRVFVKPSRTFTLPEFPGSMYRGALGHALLSRLCMCKDIKTHRPDCLYAHIFEGYRRNNQDGIPAVIMTALEHSQRFNSNETFSFYIHFLDLSPLIQKLVLEALKQGLQTGLGQTAVPCELTHCSIMGFAMPTGLRRLELELATPWFIKCKGQLLTAKTFRIHDLLVGLAHRQRMIAEHFNIPLIPPSNEAILTFADSLHVDADLHDTTWIRQSNRQHKRHPLVGVFGNMSVLANEPFPEWFCELMVNGLVLHGGGKTALGLGALKIDFSNTTEGIGGHTHTLPFICSTRSA